MLTIYRRVTRSHLDSVVDKLRTTEQVDEAIALLECGERQNPADLGNRFDAARPVSAKSKATYGLVNVVRLLDVRS